MRNYRWWSFFLSMLFLAGAFASKYYSGPHFHYIDAYFGDLFIVACLYFWTSIILPSTSLWIKGGMIAAIAVAVELFQLTGLPRSLNLPEPYVFILGSAFDPFDFVYYFIGILMAVIMDMLLNKFALSHTF